MATRLARAKNRLSVKFKLALRSRRNIKRGVLIANFALVSLIIVFVVNNVKADTPSDSAALSSVTTTDINPLDQASSADIALTVAQASNLPESTAVANQAQTAAANEAMASDTDNIVTKPEVVTTALKSRADIVDYTTVSGDTVASLAQKFGVTSNSIMWSNKLTSDTLSPGQHLVIPPVNGIIYTVAAGDTTASLAQKYGANEQQIIAYNDAEVGGLKVGEQIIIPDGQVQTSTTTTLATTTSSTPILNSSGYNGYDFGYCTWYVATQVAVPSGWGNASSWAYYASRSGWNVSTTPTVGSVAQTALVAGGEGHVAVVDGVNGNMIHIRDMNDYGDGGGWDKVGNGWVSASSFQHFITP